MHLKAFSIRQRGGRTPFDIYVSTLPAYQLIERCAIDRWTPDNREGYQRLPDERRLSGGRGSAVRYLMKELGCFPTSILLNVRGDLRFEPEMDLGWCALGKLTIGDDEKLWLIDGQHRVEALKRAVERNADFEEYPVIVSLLRLPRMFDELMLFYIVNRRQRSVPTDLAYRHLQRMLWERGAEWLYELEGRRGVRLGLAAEIVDYLNEDPRSPWRGRVRRIGEERRQEHIIHDRPLIRSVAEILKERAFEGMPIRDLADLLIDYWNAIAKIYPDAFERPQAYTLLATPGVFSLHMLFPSVYARCVRGGFITEEAFRGVLERMLEETPGHPQPEFRSPVTLDFWSKGHGPAIAISTSLQTIKTLYLNLARKIQIAEEGHRTV
ncbi:MAG: DGQHR domain-containing protein [Candidatus Bathyarchaeia archaeon]